MQKKLLVFTLLLVAIGLSGCKKNKKVYTHSSETSIEIPSNQGKLVKNSIFDEDVEAFVLDEDAQDSYNQDSHSLANNLDLTWEEPSSNPKQIVYFDYDSSAIKPEQEVLLAADIAQKKELVKAGHDLNIVGHACRYHGTKAYNLVLSERRAQHVAKKYEAAGIPKSHIKVIGIGNEEPIAFDSSKEGQAPNRRVEIAVLS